MGKYSISYSSIEDVYALAEDETGEEKKELLQLAEDLEQTGVGYYGGEQFIYRDTRYGMEVVSEEDLASEDEDGEDW